MLSRSRRPFLQRLAYRIGAGGRSSPLVVDNHTLIHGASSSRPAVVAVRHWSAKVNVDEKKTEMEEKESFQDTVRRMQQKDGKFIGNDESNDQIDGFMRKARETWASFSEEVGKTWSELIKSGDRKDINKKLIHPEETAAGEAPYTGSVEIMVIDESEHLTAWERMQRRLTEAPIISGE